MSCFISLQISQENLDELVENYTNGKVLPNCGSTITYGSNSEVLCILTGGGLNVQQIMTTLLPQIHTDAVPPNNIANLTQKVKKHLSTGKEENEVVKSLIPPKEDPNKISDYCTSAGITADILHSSECLDISSKFLTNELIYDLEKYRQKNRFP